MASVMPDRRMKIQPQVLIAVVQYSAYVSGIISVGMVVALVLSVIASFFTGKPADNTIVIALVTSLGSGLTNGLSIMALLFSHNQQTGAEIGRGVIAAAEQNEGMPIKAADESENDKDVKHGE